MWKIPKESKLYQFLESNLLNSDEACQFLEISMRTLNRWCQYSMIPIIYQGQLRYFWKEDIDWLKKMDTKARMALVKRCYHVWRKKTMKKKRGRPCKESK